MSKQAIELVSGCPIATAFFGGLSRGKVVQMHMTLDQLKREPGIVEFLVKDSESGFVEPFGEWVARESRNAGMVLFTEIGSEPKIQTVPVEVK